MSQQANPREREALQKIIWFGIVQLVGLASGWVAWFYVAGSVFSSTAILTLQTNSTAAISTALKPLFQGIAVVVPVTAVIEVVGLVLLTLAFRGLRGVDRAAFSLPSTLMLLMLVGAVLAVAGAVPFLDAIPGVIAQAPTTNSAASSAAFISAFAPLVPALAVLAIGGLLAFIGLIGGQILGLWRVGSRYNETAVKLGAIFAVIPVLDLAAPVLVIVGAHQARERIPPPT